MNDHGMQSVLLTNATHVTQDNLVRTVRVVLLAFDAYNISGGFIHCKKIII